MDIHAIGDSSFRLTGKTMTVAFFPPKAIKSDIVISEKETGHEARKVIFGPGEYEIGGVSVFAYTFGYFVELDEVRVFYALSADAVPSEDDISKIGEVDILLVPVGTETEKYVSKITPSVVIPFGDTKAYAEKQGIQDEPAPKLSVKSGSFLSDSTKTVLLSVK